MASPTSWTWVSVNSGSWWWTGRPGVLRFMGSQRVGHSWATELNWFTAVIFFSLFLLAVLGLHCCRGFCLVMASRGYLLLYSGFSLLGLLLSWSTGSRSCRLQQLWLPDSWNRSSVVGVHGLSLWYVGSSQIRDWTRVSCIGRQIIYHWASREAQEVCLILEVCFTGPGTCTFSGAYLVRPANHIIKIFGVIFPKQYLLVNKLVTCFLKINSLEKSPWMPVVNREPEWIH